MTTRPLSLNVQPGAKSSGLGGKLIKITIHQPSYLPWMGVLDKIAKADLLIILDTAQFSKNGYDNRVKIKTPQGPQWLTQPISKAKGSFIPINEVEFANDLWKTKHIKTITANYAKSPYFSEYSEELFDLLRLRGNHLAPLNSVLLAWCLEKLSIQTPFTLASRNPSDLTGTDRLIELIRIHGGSTYISGAGGIGYQVPEKFKKHGIKLEINHFEDLPYKQLWGDYIPGLSCIDYILNGGAHGAT